MCCLGGLVVARKPYLIQTLRLILELYTGCIVRTCSVMARIYLIMCNIWQGKSLVEFEESSVIHQSQNFNDYLLLSGVSICQNFPCQMLHKSKFTKLFPSQPYTLTLYISTVSHDRYHCDNVMVNLALTQFYCRYSL